MFLKAIHKDGYEEKYATLGTRFFWLHNGVWVLGSTTWEEIEDNIRKAGIELVEWVPTPEQVKKLEER